MAVDTSQFRNGLKIELDGEPFVMTYFQHVKPGKGAAFTRTKFKNLLTGSVIEKNIRSGEKLEPANVEERDMQFLYKEGDDFVFMDQSSYEQVAADEKSVGDAKLWLKEQDVCTVTLWNGSPIAVMPPNHVVLKVTETDPGVRGDTASGATKPATLETGAVVQVPLFIKEGETIRVDTRSGDYVERVG